MNGTKDDTKDDTETPLLSFAQIWDMFAQDMIPEDASEDQIKVLRHTFYCGAISLLAFGRQIRKHEMSPEDAVRQMESVTSELRMYQQSYPVFDEDSPLAPN